MKRVLVWNSSTEIRNKVIQTLGESYEIEVIDGANHSHQGDLIILDLTFSGDRALEFCSNIKSNPETESISVVCLTDGNTEMAVAGYSAGADECFSSCTEQSEFLARIAARLKFFKAKHMMKTYAEGVVIELDTINQTLCARSPDNKIILVDLTPHEFRLVLHLIERKTKIVPRAELMTAAWGAKVNVLPRTVDKHISSLRDKVRNICRVESVRGNGYILNFAPDFTASNNNPES